jgi:hypothetical protein
MITVVETRTPTEWPTGIAQTSKGHILDAMGMNNAQVNEFLSSPPIQKGLKWVLEFQSQYSLGTVPSVNQVKLSNCVAEPKNNYHVCIHSIP